MRGFLERNSVLLRAAVIALGILFVILGLISSEHSAVLGKAVRVCLECIGIG